MKAYMSLINDTLYNAEVKQLSWLFDIEQILSSKCNCLLYPCIVVHILGGWLNIWRSDQTTLWVSFSLAIKQDHTLAEEATDGQAPQPPWMGTENLWASEIYFFCKFNHVSLPIYRMYQNEWDNCNFHYLTWNNLEHAERHFIFFLSVFNVCTMSYIANIQAILKFPSRVL